MTARLIPFFRIEPLSPDQLQLAANFLSAMWLETYRELDDTIREQRTPEFFEAYLSKRIDRCWIAVSGKQVVGLTSISSNCIDDLWVEKKYQRRNIGRQLVEKVIHNLQGNNVNFIQVGCESFNLAAINFFTSNNWYRLGTQAIDIMPGRQVDVIVFGKKVNTA